MATPHCTIKHSKSSMSKTGHATPAQGHYNYIAREGKYSEGEKAEELIEKWSKNMPDWAENDPGEFWEAADENEPARNRTYSEIEIALPHELAEEQQRELVEDFCEEMFGDKHAYTVAIHDVLKGKDKESEIENEDKMVNRHAHIMFCEREIDGIYRDRNTYHTEAAKTYKDPNRKQPDPAAHGARKDRAWHDREAIKYIRKEWERVHNRHLELNGHETKISMETLEKQHQEALERGDLDKAARLKRRPEEHLGPYKASKRDKEPLALEDAERMAMGRIIKGEGRDISNELKEVYKKLKELDKAERANNKKRPPNEREADRIEAERQEVRDREAIAKVRRETLQEKLNSPETKAEIEKQKEEIFKKNGQIYSQIKKVEQKRLEKIEKELDQLNKKLERGPRDEATLDKMAKSNWERVYKEKMPDTPEAQAKTEKWKEAWRKEDEQLSKGREKIIEQRDELQDEVNKAKGLPTRADLEKEKQQAAKEAEKQQKAHERSAEVEAATKTTGAESSKELKEKRNIISKEINRLKDEAAKLQKTPRTDEQMRELAEKAYKDTKYYQDKNTALERQEKQIKDEVAQYRKDEKALKDREPGLLSLPSTRKEYAEDKQKLQERGKELSERWKDHQKQVEAHKTAINNDPKVKAAIEKYIEKLRDLERQQIPKRGKIEKEIEKLEKTKGTLNEEIKVKQKIEKLEDIQRRIERGERDPLRDAWLRDRGLNQVTGKQLINDTLRSIKQLDSQGHNKGGMGSIKASILKDLEKEENQL